MICMRSFSKIIRRKLKEYSARQIAKIANLKRYDITIHVRCHNPLVRKRNDHVDDVQDIYLTKSGTERKIVTLKTLTARTERSL